MSINFQTLWDTYPLGDRKTFFVSLSGGWPKLVNEPAYVNTCALRMTVALRGSGATVPESLAKSDGNLKDGNGNHLLLRVATIKAWLEQLLGPSSWGTSKQVGADIEGLIPKRNGILLYRVPNATDASGHVDIWDGTTCKNDCHSEFARSATAVELWFL